MKQLFTALILLACTSLLAQKGANEFRLSANCLGFPAKGLDALTLGGTASYFRYVEPRFAVGLKTSYQATGYPRFDKSDNREQTGAIDLVARVSTKTHRLIVWSFEAGPSVERTETYFSPFGFFGFDCGVGVTEEDIKRMEYQATHGIYGYATHAGLSFTTLMTFNTSSKIRYGMEINNRVYRNFSRDENLWFPSVGVFAAYRW